jgi:transposase
MTPAALKSHLTALGYVHAPDSHRSGIDITAVAAMTGCTRDTISRYLTGKATPPRLFCLALAALRAKLRPLE